jgi:prepilin-type processing-associated H-X9-DG protein
MLGRCCGAPSLTTWTLSILPYVEGTALQNAYNFELANDRHFPWHPQAGQVVFENETVRVAKVAVFTCPSDLRTSQTDRPESGPGSGLQYAPGSYRSVSGATDGRDGDVFWDNGNIGRWLRNNGYPFPSMRGVMHVIGSDLNGNGAAEGGLVVERMADILDGTSNTSLVSEYHTKTRNRRRSFWGYTYTSYNQSSANPYKAAFAPNYEDCNLAVQRGIIPAPAQHVCKRGFGSLHPGGLNLLKADGSVVFIKDTVNLIGVWMPLATVEGGEILSADQY